MCDTTTKAIVRRERSRAARMKVIGVPPSSLFVIAIVAGGGGASRVAIRIGLLLKFEAMIVADVEALSLTEQIRRVGTMTICVLRDRLRRGWCGTAKEQVGKQVICDSVRAVPLVGSGQAPAVGAWARA